MLIYSSQKVLVQGFGTLKNKITQFPEGFRLNILFCLLSSVPSLNFFWLMMVSMAMAVLLEEKDQHH